MNLHNRELLVPGYLPTSRPIILRYSQARRPPQTKQFSRFARKLAKLDVKASNYGLKGIQNRIAKVLLQST